MSEDIQKILEIYCPNIHIEVKYIDIEKYEIRLIKYNKNNDIIKKSVTFEYKWDNNSPFASNIEQIIYTINKYFKLYLESEVN